MFSQTTTQTFKKQNKVEMYVFNYFMFLEEKRETNQTNQNKKTKTNINGYLKRLKNLPPKIK